MDGLLTTDKNIKVLHVQKVKLPESYDSKTGILVDVTDILGSVLIDAWIMRGSYGGVLFEITEEEKYIFPERRLVIRAKFPFHAFKPEGSVGQPEFLGREGMTTGVSAGVPKGFVSKPEFTGVAEETTKSCAGTPVGVVIGSVQAPVLGGSPLPPHCHETHPKGEVSQPVFTGEGLDTHIHQFVPSGLIRQGEFTGVPLEASPAVEVPEGMNLQKLTGFEVITIGVIGA